jgi:hypothetical protein
LTLKNGKVQEGMIKKGEFVGWIEELFCFWIWFYHTQLKNFS